MSSRRSMPPTLEAARLESGRILSGKFLREATSKNDMVKRLRVVLRRLREDENVEANNPHEYPGLAALCQYLTRLVNHRDKEIRLYTVAACMELFTIYAPEAPWNELETLEIFKQTIRQLANLAHSLRAPSESASGGSQNRQVSTNNVHFYQYYRILELLAEVKIAVLLVDLSKKNDENHQGEDDDIVDIDGSDNDSDDDDDSSDDSSTSNEKNENARRRSPRKHSSRNQKSATSAKTKRQKPKVNINQEALQVLTELFRTLLQSVRNEHPTEIFDFCQKALTSCVEEFFESVIIPVPILDELLVCIGQGPRVLVLQQQQQQTKSKETDQGRSKRGRKRTADGTTPPVLVAVQQQNPSYMVASAVVRASVDRLSTPIASLLNGLVNSDPRSKEQSIISNHACENTESEESIKKKNGVPEEVLEMVNKLGKPQRQQQDIHGTSNVYSVILELHRVAPAILTTVFGNLASHVDTTDVAQRMLVVQTLGKLFVGNQSKSAAGTNLQVAYQYNPCFRQWLRRSKDKLLGIRRIMLPHLLALIKAGSPFLSGSEVEASSPQVELAKDVQEALVMLLADESAELRNQIIQELCTMSYQHRKILSRRLMDHVGERVMAKDKTERKYALTGLVQLYFQQYIRHHLGTVLEGGDDCPIESVLEVLNECCQKTSSVSQGIGHTSLIAARSKASALSSLSGRSSPRKSKKKARAKRRRRSGDSDSEESDHSDEEHDNSRDLSLAEETDDFSYYQWIPCVLFESASYSDATDSDMHSRVVQLVDELLLGCSSPHPENRRQLTSTGRATGLALVVDAVRNQSNVAWLWMGQLQSIRAKLQKTVKAYLDARKEIRNFETGTEAYFAADAKAFDLLERVATMIPQPSGPSVAPEERHPVLEKFHSIKDKHVFRLLGAITNPNHSAKARARALDDLPKRVKATAGDNVQAWVKSLAKRCAMGDFINHDAIHHCVLLAQECFHEGEYDATLKFLVCIQLAVESFPSLCASDEVFGNLSELFTDCNGLRSKSSKKTGLEHAIVTALTAILASVSPHRDSGKDTADFEADLQKKLIALCQNGTPEQARHAVATMASLLKSKNDEEFEQEGNDAFKRLLENLATPSRLAISSTGSSTKLICVLAALAELADHAPKVFESSSRGGTALKFALEMVLMGRAHLSKDDDESDSDSASDSDDEIGDTNTAKRGRTSMKSINAAASHLNTSGGDHNLLEDENLSVSCRTLCVAMEFLSTFIRSSIFTAKNTRSILSQATLDLINQVFNLLSKILRDHGLPPSSKDRKACSLGQDKAALRQCAAINLFRLCDTRLGLDQKFLTTERWHYLASSLLDEDLVVRKAAIEELGLMITCNGKFAATQGLGAMAPRLRFVAMSVFCIDGSQGFHSRANGNAANIGKNINKHKRDIAECINYLRKVYEENAALCQAQGREAEERFETFTKLTVMPEYSIPYAMHLLACRDETPSSARSGRRNAGKAMDDDDYEVDETGQKVLRKRLKSLYDPIVLQLGASADNISFLLRMAEMLAKSFQPIGCPSFSSENDDGEKEQDKLTNVCATAREVLLSYVKKDVNLDTHPGAIRMPGNLFRKKGIRKRSAKTLSKNTMVKIESEVAIDATAAGSTKLVDNNRSKIIGGDDSKMKDEGKANSRITRKSIRSATNHDESVSKLSVDTFSGIGNDDNAVESIEDDKKRRRSTRSTRSTKFDDPNDSKLSDSIGTEIDRTGDGSQPSTDFASAIDSVNSVNLHSPDEKENPSGTRRSTRSNKKRRSELSQGSLLSSRVHFSPDADFGGLTPINRRESRDFEKDQSLLSSSETKTRGGTPPSSLRESNFTGTASVAVGNTRSRNSQNSQTPTTVSESTMDQSIGLQKGRGKKKPLGDTKIDANQSRQKRGTGKLASIDKDNTNTRVQKKKQDTKQIKVVRSKFSLKDKSAKVASKTARAGAAKRTRGRKSKPVDTFDFEG